jgi:hypothetical protein
MDGCLTKLDIAEKSGSGSRFALLSHPTRIVTIPYNKTVKMPYQIQPRSGADWQSGRDNRRAGGEQEECGRERIRMSREIHFQALGFEFGLLEKLFR